MNTTVPRVLVLDDDDSGLYVKQRILTRAGYEVLTAQTGTDALKIINDEFLNVAVLDVQLPDMNGMDICRQLKSKKSPILVLQTSATYIRGADRVMGLESGADAYLIEPVEADELVATVNALLRISRAESELRGLNESLEQRVAERTYELAEANRRISQEIIDRQKAEEALRQAQKMEALGQLTGGIAHDFNNLLTVIYGGLEAVQRKLTIDDPNLVSTIDHSMIAAKRATGLTQRLLAFARRQPLEPKPTNINDLVKETSEMLRRTLGEHISLRVILADKSLYTNIDANQLENALLNLAVNARDAIADSGTLTIETMLCTSNDKDHWDNAETQGGYVRISVTDNGKGMSAEVREKAFDPFFTTKAMGQGTGLGLSQVYGFVKQSGGDISLRSNVGEGTTVDIYLPRSLEDSATTTASPFTVPHDGANAGTVLVVEDNDIVRLYSSDVLCELGYLVFEAVDAESALAVLKQHPDISVLFTDIGLPGDLDGHQLAIEAKRLYPQIKILYTTGYIQNPHTLTTGTDEPLRLIRKPFTYDELANKLRELCTNN